MLEDEASLVMGNMPSKKNRLGLLKPFKVVSKTHTHTRTHNSHTTVHYPAGPTPTMPTMADEASSS